MREIDRHVDMEELEMYSMGSTAMEESTIIEEHLLTCESCRARLQEADEFSAAMQTAARRWRRDERLTKGREWKFPSWFPALAAVACGVLLMLVVQRFVRPSGPVVAVSLTALRGSGAGSRAPARRELNLHPDLTGLTEASAYRVEIVDLRGRAVGQGNLVREQDGMKVRGLAAGQYFVRVYLPAGELLREYGLEIQ